MLVLNNDTELPQGVLLAFVNGLTRSRNTGLLGPVTNSIGNEAEIYAPYRPDRKEELDAWFGELAHTRFGWRFEIEAPALFAAIMRREDLEAVGGLSDRYQVGMFEDDELAERIRRFGKQVVGAEDVFVHHAGGAAFRTLDPVVYQAIFDRNRRVFESAVGRPWNPHRTRADKRKAVPRQSGEDGQSATDPSSATDRVSTPSLSYFVCGSPRSGTTLLCSLLESSGVAGSAREYFWRDDVGDYRQAWKTPSVSGYLAEVMRRSTTPNGVFGAKLMWNHFDAVTVMLRIASREPDAEPRELSGPMVSEPPLPLDLAGGHGCPGCLLGEGASDRTVVRP